jgi:CRP/FNR family cyclic AMP-dependent transcriptional regulator
MSKRPAVIETLPIKAFGADEVVIEEGSPPGALYFLDTGVVEVSKDGVAITKVKDQGAVFGEMSVFLGAPHTATVRTVTDATFHVAENAVELLASNPETSMYVATILAQRLDGRNRYLVDVKSQFKDAQGHLAMVDEVLDTLMTKPPRSIARRPQPGP